MIFNASASKTSGTRHCSRTVDVMRRARCPVPIPGPNTTASAHCSCSASKVSSSFSCPVTRTASGTFVCRISRFCSQVNTRTRPLPIRYAAFAQKHAAPDILTLPAIISNFPYEPLLVCAIREGSFFKSSGSRTAVCGLSSSQLSCVIPMETTCTFPQYSLPGHRYCPFFPNENVIVSSARKAVPSTAPSSELIPEAISTATFHPDN